MTGNVHLLAFPMSQTRSGTATLSGEIERLRNGDAEAWNLVLEKSVRMEMNRFRHSMVVHKWCIDEEDLMGELYEDMVVRGKLSMYRGDGDIYGWLGKYVVGYIYRFNPERRREIPMESVIPSDRAFIDETFANHEDRCLVDRCFGRLWRKNPMRAYVHYLRLNEGMSSREICRFFGLSSMGNVDQMFFRAVKSMRKLRDEYV